MGHTDSRKEFEVYSECDAAQEKLLRTVHENRVVGTLTTLIVNHHVHCTHYRL